MHTRTPDTAVAKEFGIEYASLDEVLRRADMVCLFASLTKDTRRMIGARELGLMRASAYLINIARGELIDQDALVDALRTGKIAGAGLDVFEVEPLFDSPLFALDNVVLTPHQAGLTQGGKAGAALRAARNALHALDGAIPRDAINPRAWATEEPSDRRPHLKRITHPRPSATLIAGEDRDDAATLTARHSTCLGDRSCADRYRS